MVTFMDRMECESMKFKMVDCENTLMREIDMKELHQKDIAQTYRLAMESGEDINWYAVNLAIMRRWSKSGLIKIKEMAWSGKCFNYATDNN
jgi:hypothetical protein